MGALLIILIIVAMGLVLVAIVRGLGAFAAMKPDELGEDGIPKGLALQNRMMFARVKWQAIAILLVGALLVLSQAG